MCALRGGVSTCYFHIHGCLRSPQHKRIVVAAVAVTVDAIVVVITAAIVAAAVVIIVVTNSKPIPKAT